MPGFSKFEKATTKIEPRAIREDAGFLPQKLFPWNKVEKLSQKWQIVVFLIFVIFLLVILRLARKL